MAGWGGLLVFLGQVLGDLLVLGSHWSLLPLNTDAVASSFPKPGWRHMKHPLTRGTPGPHMGDPLRSDMDPAEPSLFPLWALDEIGHRWKRLLSTYILWEKTRLMLFDFHVLARRQRPPAIGGAERI